MKHIIIIALFALFTNLLAAIGTIKSIRGDATIERQSKIIKATLGAEIEKNDIIKTIDKAKVKLVFSDNTVIHLSKNAHFSVEEYLFDDTAANSKMEFQVLSGMFKGISGKIGKVAPSKFKLKTRTATIGIRGTKYQGFLMPIMMPGVKPMTPAQMRNVPPAQLPDMKLTVGCLDGAIAVGNEKGSVIVNKGMMTSVIPGLAPIIPTPFNKSFTATLPQDGGDDEGGDDQGGNDSAAEDDGAAEDDQGGDDKAAEDDGGDDQGGDATANDAAQDDDGAGTPDGGGTDSTETPDALEAEVPTGIVDDAGDAATQTQQTSVNGEVVEDTTTVVHEEVGTSTYPTDTTTITDTTTDTTTPTTTTPTQYTTVQKFIGSGISSVVPTDPNDPSEATLAQTWSAGTSLHYTFDVENDNFTSTGTELTGTINISNYDITAAYDPASFDTSVGTFYHSITDASGLNSYSADFSVYMDNRGEFMYGVNKDGLLANDGGFLNGSYRNLFYTGKVSTEALDPTKLYIYEEMAYQDVEHLPIQTSSPYASFGAHLGQAPDSYLVLSGKFKTISPKYVRPGPDFYGANEYLSHTIDTSDPIGSSNTGISMYLDPENRSITYDYLISPQLYGSEFQGLGASYMSQTHTIDGNYDYSTPDFYSIGASVNSLQSTSTVSSKTGEVTLTGCFNWQVLDLVNPAYESFATINSHITLNRDTGSVSVQTDTSTSQASPNAFMYFDGIINDIDNTDTIYSNSSYYVSDDNFGAISSAGTTNGINTQIPYGGFIVSRPDTLNYDANTDTYTVSENSNDYSSWGYWTSGFTETGGAHLVSPLSTWVAGQETKDMQSALGNTITSLADLDALVPNTSKPTFTGHIIGAVMIPGTGLEPILLNNGNIVNIQLNLSDGAVTGDIAFNSANSSWNQTIDVGPNSTINLSTFDNFSFVTSDPANAAAAGNGSGRFFGPNIESVGGTFNSFDSITSKSANGVFKAAR